MGFQHMRDIVHQAASRKGGSIKTDKGLAKLPDEKRREIASMGGLAKNANKCNKSPDQNQDNKGSNTGLMERVLEALNE